MAASRVPRLTQFISPTLLDRYDLPNCEVNQANISGDPHATQKLEQANLHAEKDCLKYEVERLMYRLRAVQRGAINYAIAMEGVIFGEAARDPIQAEPKKAPTSSKTRIGVDTEPKTEASSEGYHVPLPPRNPISEDVPAWVR